jgi:hypothetical protein
VVAVPAAVAGDLGVQDVDGGVPLQFADFLNRVHRFRFKKISLRSETKRFYAFRTSVLEAKK